MADIDTLTQKVTDLETTTAASVTKSDALIALVTSLKADLAAALANGTAPDLTGLISRIDAVNATLSSETDKEAAAAS